MLQVDITAEDVFTKLRALVQYVVPLEVEVVQGLDNRVPMPPGPHVVMTAGRLTPHRTPQVEWDRNNPAVDSFQIEQGTLFRVQLDCYSPLAQNWAVMLSALFRNDKGVELLAPSVVPLYCSEPKQAALVDGEQQYIDRWIVDAHVQYNPVISVPQEFANAAEVEVINVDERFPP